ncbi:hypothetical protein SUGI_1194550 [Cryptomeria japonica]|uniref:RING-H2 finger protein ATL5-like n=1 Tax=Cryptomeria japonica TaxID=3369 RepID=UPI002414B775|nr:RING-H2 finger protein ATL5-like [Cryptomeria japonica]GLJ55622.1 hypothetical protein SUGI_1194550 [Cryptomeria japonica]
MRVIRVLLLCLTYLMGGGTFAVLLIVFHRGLLWLLILAFIIVWTFLSFIVNTWASMPVRQQSTQNSAGPQQRLPPSSSPIVNKIAVEMEMEMGVFNYRCDEEGEKECVICLCEYKEDDAVVALKPCHHNFHVDCIRRWLQCKLQCPLCNACPLYKSGSHAQNDVALQIPPTPPVAD